MNETRLTETGQYLRRGIGRHGSSYYVWGAKAVRPDGSLCDHVHKSVEAAEACARKNAR